MPKRLTYEYVRTEFEKYGYVLLSKNYDGSAARLAYKCPENHIHSTSWDNFKSGKRCPYCSGNARHSIEFIKSEFIYRGYVLLTNEYKNSCQKLRYICPNGHRHAISWAHFRKGHGCRYCAGRTKLTIDYIRPHFEREGYILLAKVCNNSHQKLDYVCVNMHRHSISWNNWQAGKRCRLCADVRNSISLSGSGHPNWKGGISCEPYCQDWTKEYKNYIKERDGYICLNPDCWKTVHRLVVHHVDYIKKNCRRSNLITLCNSCNIRANKDRGWHTAWYKAIIEKRYGRAYE